MRPLFEPAHALSRGDPPFHDHARLIGNIRRLIWLYLFLLVMEGALRKWIVPQFSDPLLLVRDPVVILIYFLAWRARIFPSNWFLVTLLLIAALSQIAGMIVLRLYLPPMKLLFVTLYGMRSNFLHLPLIFVIANALDAAQVKRVGWWILLGMIPMTLLTAAQFRAPPESAINRAVGLADAQQITAGHGALNRGVYKASLLLSAGSAIVIGVVVSGSRSAVASVGIVLLSLLVIILIKPAAINRFARSLLVVFVAGWALSYLPIFREGVEILSARFTESAAAEETTVAGGMLSRTFSGFTEGLSILNRLPIGGYGLGIGTNGGANFLTGRTAFLLAEGEWSRILLESGPVLGLSFLLWRTILTVWLGCLSLRALARGETLPILLFSAGFSLLLNGQFGQATTLGFAVILNGLCLASINPQPLSATADATEIAYNRSPVPRVLRPGRSPYAARLHGDAAEPISHGAVDR